MVGYRYLILLVGLLLCSCAQVGTISGGEKDITAPKPVADKINPLNGSTRFMVKEVEIPFDEFFRLNNANINIRIVPSHTTIQSRVKGKSLFLSWEDDLQENTTYAIYLNNAVKDITESNDSIIQYVFSTGDELDTLSYSIYVADSWSGKPVAGCLVGIFDPETEELQSFTETDNNGFAKLRYLKEGSYRLAAFMDENGDLEVQKHEAIAFPENDQITLDSAIIDSLPIRLFTPLQEPKIRTSVYISPGYALIGTNRPIVNEALYVNGEQLKEDQYKRLAEDSLEVYMSIAETSSAEFVLKSTEVTDTVTFRFSKSDKEKRITLRPLISNGVLSPWDSVSYFCNDFITSVDTSLIEIVNVTDTTPVHDYTVSTAYNAFEFSFADRENLESLKITLHRGAITTTHGTNTKLITTVKFQSERKYGSLNIDLGYYANEAVILSVLNNGKLIDFMPIKPGSPTVLLDGLAPGDYTFDIVRDENANGRWDVGDYTSRTQPELVDHYSSPTTVRANWEVELSLIPNSDE